MNKKRFRIMSERQDYSKSNPGLHLLHLKWAIKHLHLINKCIEMLSNESCTSLINIISAMDSEKRDLIKNNQAYTDGNEILESIQEKEVE